MCVFLSSAWLISEASIDELTLSINTPQYFSVVFVRRKGGMEVERERGPESKVDTVTFTSVDLAMKPGETNWLATTRKASRV